MNIERKYGGDNSMLTFSVFIERISDDNIDNTRKGGRNEGKGRRWRAIEQIKKKKKKKRESVSGLIEGREARKMRHVTPLRALRSPGKPVNFSSAKHPRISAASNLFPRKNILLFALSEKSSDFFLETGGKGGKFLYFPFLFSFSFLFSPKGSSYLLILCKRYTRIS